MKKRLWITRAFIIAVLVMNLMAAFDFIINPAPFARGFELEGAVGDAAIRGIGILFLMWNIPYFFAAWHPLRNKISFIEAIIMQTVGVVGETLLYLNLPAEIEKADKAVLRFIIFDAGGLIFLLIGLVILFPLLEAKNAD